MPDITATRPAAGAPIDTPWGQQVHDMLEGIQSGQASVAGSGTGVSVTVTFPRAYSAIPVVVATTFGSTTTAVVAVNSITTTNFVLRIYTPAGQTLSGTQVANWLAIGTPA